jgi:hypothetical protein
MGAAAGASFHLPSSARAHRRSFAISSSSGWFCGYEIFMPEVRGAPAAVICAVNKTGHSQIQLGPRGLEMGQHPNAPRRQSTDAAGSIKRIGDC